jgi:hypothetical protein
MAVVVIEQLTSQLSGIHLTDCAIVNVTNTFISSWCDFQRMTNIHLLYINSRKQHGPNRSGIEYLNECYTVFICDRLIKSDNTVLRKYHKNTLKKNNCYTVFEKYHSKTAKIL